MDPADPKETGDFTNSNLLPLYGPSNCTGSPSTCTGGMTGVFLSVKWSDLQSAPNGAGGATQVVTDYAGHVLSMMQDIYNIETAYNGGHSGTFSFLMTLGLKTGQYTAYDVLDMYTAARGAPTGTAPALGTSRGVTSNLIEGNCQYTFDSGGNPDGHAQTFDASNGFPEQCVLSKTAAGKYQCTAMPRIFGADSPSKTNNPYYVTAYTQALQDLADLVTGVTGYGSSAMYAHHFQALKLAGLSNSDEEVVISGRPQIAMPSYNCGGNTCYYYCGYESATTPATDAEMVWTNQTDADGNLIYQTNFMQDTWYDLVTGATGVTSSYGDSLSYVIDSLGTSEFPPVQPEDCSTDCVYTPTGDAIRSAVTTGEMEHLIQRTLIKGLVEAGKLSIQEESLQYNVPDNDESVEKHYATGELPCALNALLGTSIGYQSAGAEAKLDYLNSITNGAAYGAQYIGLMPEQIEAFLTDDTEISIYGYTNYGNNLSENQNLLSIAISLAQATMATNAANSSLGTLCPLPEKDGSALPWVYPYDDPESPADMTHLLWANDIPSIRRTQAAADAPTSAHPAP